MKTLILNRMMSTAAAIILPVAAFAQNDGADVSSGAAGVDPSLSPTGSNELPNTQGYDTGTIPPPQSEQPGPFSTGVIVKDGSAYVIHKLQNEMSLPDGSKVQPNGMIKNSDGSTRSMGSGQILSIDGRMMESPFGMESTTGQNTGSGLFDSNRTPGWSTGLGPDTSSTTPGTATPPTGQPFQDQSRTTLDMPDDNNVNSSPAPESSELNGGTPDISQPQPSPDYTD
jgi:hypothetical protein